MSGVWKSSIIFFLGWAGIVLLWPTCVQQEEAALDPTEPGNKVWIPSNVSDAWVEVSPDKITPLGWALALDLTEGNWQRECVLRIFEEECQRRPGLKEEVEHLATSPEFASAMEERNHAIRNLRMTR